MDSSSRAYSLRPFSLNVDSEVSCSGPALKFLEWTIPPEISVRLLASTRLARVPALNSPSTFKLPPIVALPVVFTVAASMDPTLVRLPPCKVAVPSVMLLPWTLPVATISPLMLVVPLTVRLPPLISPFTERLAPVRAPFALISPRAEMLPVEVTVPPVTVPPVMVPVVLMLPLVMVAVPSVRVAPFTVPAPALMLPPLVATLPAVSTVNLPSAPLMLPSALRAALAAAAVSPPA